MRQRKSALAIINQGLSAVFDWIAGEGAGTAPCNNGSVEFRLVTANGVCHDICGRNCVCFKGK